jgi:hypothetical protein
VFSTVAWFHYFTTFTTGGHLLKKLARVWFLTRGVRGVELKGKTWGVSRENPVREFFLVSNSGSECSEVVKPSLGCRMPNGYGNSTVFPCRHETQRNPHQGEANPKRETRRGVSSLNNKNRGNKHVGRDKKPKQARLTGFIDKPRQPSTQTTIEEDWDKVLRPEKKKVIPCSELGDECRFYHNCLELFEWRSWSGEPVFQRPKGYFEIEELFTSEEHERLHKKLYELVINGKQQEAVKLWEEIAEKELPTRMEKARRRNRELLMEWVRKNCSNSAVENTST